MSKTLTAPDYCFSGTITLPDYYYSVCKVWEGAMAQHSKLLSDGADFGLPELIEIYLPAFEECLESHKIDGWVDGKFPVGPRLSALKTFKWISDSIKSAYWGEAEIPKAPESAPITMPLTEQTV